MRAALITMRRTIGMLRSLYSTALTLGLFFAGSGALFAFFLESSEGAETPLAAIWTSAVSPVLPLAAALLSMDMWSDEKRTGRLETLLVAPVRERSFVIGKFLGIMAALLFAVAAFLVSSLAFTFAFAPRALENQSAASFIPGFLALMMQGMLWSSLSLAASAAFRHAAAAAITSIALTVAIPRGLYFALLLLLPQARQVLGDMPLDAHAFDIASGLVSSHVVLSYMVLTVLALFITSKFVAFTRLTGKGARSLKWSTITALALSVVLSALLVALFMRTRVTFELPFVQVSGRTFSARTRNILGETRGEIKAIAFISRKDPRFRPLGHFLRALSSEAEALGGAHLAVQYVDPRWDIGTAERLVRMGVTEDALVFERGRRHAVVPFRDGFDERTVSSAMLRVAMPPKRRSVYWTRGHGESIFDAYGPWGMSDIARDLSGDGYRNMALDISADLRAPEDCAFMVIAGARSDFSRAEVAWLDAYLRKGGRLLVLAGNTDAPCLNGMLSGWGIRMERASLKLARSMTGTDAIASEFTSHPVAAPMRSARIVLESPVSFAASVAADSSLGANRIEFSPLAFAGESCVAAVAERGALAGDDLALRPTRVLAIGDPSFVMNARLEAKANANRDFFMNAVAYLSGTDAITEPGIEADRLVTGMDREARLRFTLYSIFGFPGAVFLIAVIAVVRKRRRG